ncbi:tRNA1(Val) A37 N6-methylase TrmN6 [Peptoniphilus asaccharolyticus DSM 20463]|uniref:tRNA1(Val) A37 N6-methylase TrmN6 n=1 Tax=Peptoniphilus asaccharolyticus DSM 20463 TaxID=573058 RepID=A0A1W1UMT8_PEPAS|nr:methyltransferase [Peptoniphilus asaccharolyticus]MBL7574879.1 methyltransferase [Peptoniphilus asaccharolyticus]SMB82024.1 tRNA1(Val) A37 N6-methylase TrmN6 [Peptoniphilus asaccharolyticus DSM 20463]
MKRDIVPGTEYIIYQDDENFKYTFDSLALTSFAKVKGTCVDLGAGFGIIGFRVADNVEKVINIEINPKALELLELSAKENNLEEKIQNYNVDIKEIGEILNRQIADVVITNPPYFSSGLKPKDETITKARHSTELMDFFYAASFVLKNSGRFYAVLPVDRMVDAIAGLRENHIEPRRIVFIKKDIHSSSKRFLIEGIKNSAKGMKISDLILKDGEVDSEEFKKIYRNEMIG